MNPYDYNELEKQDLYCELCGELISTSEYANNDGLCDSCYDDENSDILSACSSVQQSPSFGN